MVRRNLIANYFGQGWAAFINLAIVPFYIKFLGIEAYGLIGIFTVLQVCLSLFDMGMTPTLGREMSRYTGGEGSAQSIRDLLRSVEVIVFLIALLVAGAGMLSGGWLAQSWLAQASLPTAVVAQAFGIMGAVISLRFVEGIYRSALIGLQRQVRFNIISSVMITLRNLGAVGVLSMMPTIEMFFFWQGIVSLCSLIILNIATYQCLTAERKGGQFSIDALRKVWRFAGGMMVITVLVLLLTQVDKILLPKLIPLSDYGCYILACTVAGGLYTLSTPITQAYYPKFCELHASGDIRKLIVAYHKSAQLVTVFAGSAAVVLFFFSETLLYVWTQDANLANRVTVLLSVLSVGNLLHCLMGIPYQIQLTYGWTRLAIYINSIAIILLVPALLYFTPQYGAEAAALIWLILNFIYAVFITKLMFRKIMKNEKRDWIVKDICVPLICPVIVAITCKLLWAPVQDSAEIAMMLVAISVTSIVSAALGASEVREDFINFIKIRSGNFFVKF